MENIITITPLAIEKFKESIATEKLKYVRVSVVGGGCSGLQYSLDLTNDKFDYDWDINIDGIDIVIDEFSATFLRGIEIDFENTLSGGFKFNQADNEVINRQCGCGSSFSV